MALEYNDPPGSAYGEHELAEGMRLGVQPDAGLARLDLGHSLKPEAFTLEIPATDDHITGVPAWNMGGNTEYGTCGPTSLANFLTMVYWNLSQEAVTVTDEAVFALYKVVNPDFDPDTHAGDRGVDMVTLLKAFSDHGLEITHADGTNEVVKPVAFGGLDNSLDHLKAATAVFGGAILAITLETAQQEQTPAGLWEYAPSDLWGGHAIMGAAYANPMKTAANSAPDVKIISWAAPVGTTDEFMAQQLSQSFAVILPIHLAHPNFLAGVNVEQLSADFQDLTGRPFPFSIIR